MRAKTRKRGKRRGNGEGSIYQRTDGTWCATYSAGYTADGKRRRRTIFATSREEVVDRLHKVLNDVAIGTAVDPQKITLGEFLDRWLTGTAKTTVKPTTYVNYSGVIKNHIKPHLGGISLTKLAVIHIQSLYAAMDRAGKSAETIRVVHAVLRRALKQAVRWRMVPYNVCVDVDRPRVAKADICPLNSEQTAKLLKAAGEDRLSAVFTLAIAAGGQGIGSDSSPASNVVGLGSRFARHSRRNPAWRNEGLDEQGHGGEEGGRGQLDRSP